MLLMLVLPVIAVVAATHRYVLLYAPSNVLLRRGRAQRHRRLEWSQASLGRGWCCSSLCMPWRKRLLPGPPDG